MIDLMTSRRHVTAGFEAAAVLPMPTPGTAGVVPGTNAFAFQSGLWRVRHRKLRQRLAGSTDWYEFDGSCRAWELLDGRGNVDDHWLEDPAGAYPAATVRTLQPGGDWSIWWFDPRFPGVGPALSGRFDGPVGRFEGRDTFAGREIGIRFVWTVEHADRLRWEQSFTPDEGATWELNWTMVFERVSA